MLDSYPWNSYHTLQRVVGSGNLLAGVPVLEVIPQENVLQIMVGVFSALTYVPLGIAKQDFTSQYSCAMSCGMPTCSARAAQLVPLANLPDRLMVEGPRYTVAV